MSADNWAICPKCKKALKKEPKTAYGEATEAEYLESIKERDDQLFYSLREDYTLGINEEGEFSVYYGAHCEVCGFKYEFSHKENLLE